MLGRMCTRAVMGKRVPCTRLCARVAETRRFSRTFSAAGYGLLQVDVRKATVSQVRKAFFEFAMRHHPDVAEGCPDKAVDTFLKGQAEYERLCHEVEERARGGYTPGNRRQAQTQASEFTRGEHTGHGWGTGDFRWTKPRNQPLTLWEKKVRKMVDEDKVEASIVFWETRAMCDLHLLLFILEDCRVARKMPPVPSIHSILAVLRGDDKDKKKNGSEEPTVVQETAVALQTGQKTQAYNDLIRACTYGNAPREVFYEILEAMWVAEVDKDPETFHNIDQAWQNLRQEYSAG